MLTYGAHKNERKDYRAFLNIPLTLEIIDPVNKSVTTKTLITSDISAGGLCFKSEVIFPLSTELKVRFQLPQSENMIEAVLKVKRIEAAELERFEIGTSFSSISEKDREEIKQLVERLDVNNLLKLIIKNGVSDLHLLAGHSPVIRVNGELQALEIEPFSAEEISQLLYSLMTKQQIRVFEKEKELDFAIQYDAQNRFRVNIHQQRGFLEGVFRLINTREFSFEELNIPAVVKDMVMEKEGLILVTGPTGSGKTTTISAIVDLINQEKKAVIVTLERPIEYVHTNKKSIIKQREVGIDTNSFAAALKSSLRQDPNIIVVGELDDMETIATAFIAAEAGYLVIASFHAPNSAQAIDRLASIFPVEHRREILNQLASCLKGLIVQLLLPKVDRTGRILATEVLINNDAVRRVIRNDELFQIPNIIQTGRAFKMQLMSESIKLAYEAGTIDGVTMEYYDKDAKDPRR